MTLATPLLITVQGISLGVALVLSFYIHDLARSARVVRHSSAQYTNCDCQRDLCSVTQAAAVEISITHQRRFPDRIIGKPFTVRHCAQRKINSEQYSTAAWVEPCNQQTPDHPRRWATLHSLIEAFQFLEPTEITSVIDMTHAIRRKPILMDRPMLCRS